MQPNQDKPTDTNNQPIAPLAGDGQQQPDSTQPIVGGDKPGMPKWLTWFLIVLLVLALLFGWWWFMMRDDKPTPSTSNNGSQQEQSDEEAAAAVCAEGLTNYENAELDLGFCYPTEWGTVTVEDARLSTAASEGIGADEGSRWRLMFSEKPAVNLGVVSEDWATEVGRGGSCVDPATQTLPPFSPFSTEWEVASPASFASRGIEVLADEYLIDETADEFYNGVCISGYTLIGAEDFPHSTATYFAEFGGAVTTPQQHVDSPNVLAPEADREAFYDFVKSVRAL